MPYIVVCSLARLPGIVRKHDASHVLTVISADMAVPTPDGISSGNHLRLDFNDIAVARDGLTLPGEAHVAEIVDFVRGWNRERPLVIHCWAGVSRSTASALTAMLALQPALDDDMLARLLRLRAPFASPNPKIVALADAMLARDGRLIEAVHKIGRGADCFEGTPFILPLSDEHAGLF